MKTYQKHAYAILRSLRRILGGLALLTAGLASIPAANFTWDGATDTWPSVHWYDVNTNLVAGGATTTNVYLITNGVVTFAANDTFGNANITASPIITVGGSGTLASGSYFNTIWNLTLQGGTLNPNGGVNLTFPSFQLDGTLAVSGTSPSLISAGSGNYPLVNIGGTSTTGNTLTINVADVTGNANPDLTIAATLKNGRNPNVAGFILKTGAGTLLLAGTNLYTGNTTVNGGLLQLFGGHTGGGRLIVNAGGSAVVGENAGTHLFTADAYAGSCDVGESGGTGVLTLNGGIVIVTNVDGAASMRVGVNGAANGTLTINAGTLMVPGRILIGANNAGTVGTINLNGGFLNLGYKGGFAALGSDPNRGLIWFGNGTSTLNLNGGLLALNCFYGAPGSANTRIYYNGARLQPATNTTAFDSAGTFSHNIRAGGALIDATNFNITFSKPFLHDSALGTTPDGGWTKIGSGIVTLAHNGGTYTGPTLISNGQVNVTASAGGAAPASSPLGAPGVARTVTVCSNAILYLGISDVFGNHMANPAARFMVQEGGLVNNGATYTTFLDLTLNGGELRVSGGAVANWQSYQLKGTVTVAGNATSRIALGPAPVNSFNQIHIGNNTAGGVTTFDVADGAAAVDLLVGAPLVNGLNSGGVPVAGGLTKIGGGTLQLDATNLFTGPTTVSNGTLLVNGLLTASPVTVADGTTLAGIGSLGGTLTVNGTLAPGPSLGMLTVSNLVTLNASTVMKIQKTGATLASDRLIVMGPLMQGGTLTVTASGDALAAGDRFDLFDTLSVAGGFTNLVLPALPDGLAWNTYNLAVDGTITVISTVGPPTVLQEPASATGVVGASQTFSVLVAGATPFVFQWLKDGLPIPDATNASLTLPYLRVTNAGTYSVLVTNGVGNTVSAGAVLTVLSYPPGIATQPAGGVRRPGQSHTFSLTATGSPVLAYQWFKDGLPLADATNNALALASLVPAQAGDYTVIVTNEFGAITSAVARLDIVVAPPGIRYAGNVEGDEVTAWRTAATNKTMDLSGDNIYGSWGAIHWVVGSASERPVNSALPGWAYVGEVTYGHYQNSGYPLVDKLTDPSVRIQSGIGAVQAPGSFTFELTGQLADYAGKVVRIGVMGDVLASSEWAADTFKAFYVQWTGDGTVNSGIIPLRAGGGGNGVPEMYFFDIAGAVPGDRFTLTAYNAIGGAATQAGYAGPVAWDVGALAPRLVSQPAGMTNYAGAAAVLSASAFGSQPMFYQWYKDSAPVTDATNAALAFASLASPDAGAYYVVASNLQGAATSAPVTLAVLIDPPTITSQPLGSLALAGQAAVFGVSVVGALPLSYQWFKDDAPLAPATNAALTLANLSLADAGVYHVVVANAYGFARSSNAVLTVIAENGGTVASPPPFEWLPQANDTLADSVVRFNEIMYHPAGGNPSLQWIELANVMMVDVDISGWVIDDGVHYTFPAGTVIPGGGCVVVAANVAAVAGATGLTGVKGPFTGNLANEGERLVLKNHDGRLLDEMTYRDEEPWPAGADGSGAALAKRDPLAASAEPTHWAASPQLSGTPGRANFPSAATASPLRPLVAFFDFNADAGDLSGNGLHGVVSNAVLTASSGGYEGECYSFNGSNAFVQAPINLNAAVFSQVTIGAWVSVAALKSPPRHNIFSCDNGGYDRGLTVDSRVGTADTGVARYGAFGGDSIGVVAGAPASVADGWVFVAAVYDQLAGTTTLYVGSQVYSGTAAHGPSLSLLRIGCNPSYGEYFNGRIDNAFVFRKALSAAQVQAIRTGGAAAIQALGDQLWQAEQAEAGATLAPPRLAFNEVDAATNAPFRVELHNFGLVPLALGDFTLAASTFGATNLPLPAATLNPGEFLVLDEAQLGFHPGQNDKLFLLASNATLLVDAAKVKNHPQARMPGATGRWAHPAAATLGTNNAVTVNREVVINEIMYHHAPSYPAGGYAASDEEWVELFNRGTQPADLAGWRLDGGIRFDFPSNTVLAAGGYLVVARDAAALQAAHPGLAVAGSYAGKLSQKGDLIELKDAAGNVVSEVRYFAGGRWPGDADGGGSSLELADPYADNRRPEAWAASDESARGNWQTITYRGVAAANFGYDVGNNIWNEFNLGLLDGGEFLLDDVSVIELPGTPQARQLIQNGGFEADPRGAPPAKWRVLGTHGLHGRTVVEADPANPGNQVLHVVATGPTDFLHNHLETTLKSGGSVVSVVAGREYEISFRARWLGGAALLNSRLYANWLQRTTALNVPAQSSGTPGAVNSRRVANTGPTYDALSHSPVVPPAGSNVTVSVKAYDPQGVATLTLCWRPDGGAWSSAAMTAAGEGVYQGIIPGQAAATKVQFYVRGTDGLGAVSAFPAAGPASRAMLIFNDSQAAGAPMHNFRFVMTAADTAALYQSTNRMSNQRFGATIIGNETEVYYDVGVRLKASAYGRTHDTETGLSIDFDPARKFRDAHDSISVERSGNKREILAKHLFNQAGRGIAAGYDDVAWVITPRAQDVDTGLLSMTRTTDLFLETQYGPGGTVYNFELLYTPTTTFNGDPEAVKLNYPYSHVSGEPDLQNLGDDPEAYRWNFQVRNHRTRDDSSLLIAAAKAMDQPGAGFAAATRATLDVDQWLRCFAMQSLLGTDDVYARLWNHNMRFYQRRPDNRLVAIPWDLDRTFNLSSSATLWGAGPNNAGNTNRLRRLIEYPPNLRAYYGHLLDLIDRCGNSAYATRWANLYAALTGDGVLRNYPAYLDSRAAYIRSQVPASVPFSIATSNGLAVDDTAVTLTGSGWVDVNEIRLGRQVLPVTWTGFSTWEARVPLAYGTNPFALQAYNRAGALVGSASVAVSSTVSARPLPDWLRITEIMYNPTNPPAGSPYIGADFEFVELKNIGPAPLNLTGVAFTSGLDFGFAGPAVTNVPPGGFVLLVRSRAAFASRYATNGLVIAGEYTNKLSDAGERLVLVDPSGAVIQDFAYDGGWHPTADGLGFSLVVRSAGAPAWWWDKKTGWRASTFAGGSPGADDPEPFLPGIVINEILARPPAGQLDLVELHNPYGTNVAVGGWYLTDDRKTPRRHRIPDGRSLAAGGFLVFSQADLSFGLGAQGEEIYLFSADADGNLTGWSDGFAFGASAAEVSFGRHVTSDGVDHPAQLANTLNATNAGPLIGPVVITEIQFAPADGIEFLELRNVSPAPVPLFDLVQPASTWRISGLNYAFPTNTVIPSCGVLLLTTTNEAAFRSAYPAAAGVPVLVAESGGLADGGESLELQRPDSGGYVVVDHVRYNDRGLWDTNALGSGLSLQRRGVGAYGNDPVSWVAAAPSPGLTPPAIVASPHDLVAQAGSNAVLAAAVCDPGLLGWQWRFNGAAIPDATNAVLQIAGIQLAHGGSYDVVLSNALGLVVSSPAWLVVNRAPTAGVVAMGTSVDTPGTIDLAKILLVVADADGDPLAVVAVSAGSTNLGGVVLTATNLTYRPPPDFTGADAFTCTVSDGRGGLVQVVVLVTVTNGQSQNIVAWRYDSASHTMTLNFAGIPGRTYRLQFTESLALPVRWTDFSTNTAPVIGLFSVSDSNAVTPNRFFRSHCP